MNARAVVLAAAFAVLTALVWANMLDGADQWAVDHLMAGVSHAPPRPLLEQLVPFSEDDGIGDVAVDLVALVGHPVVSTVLAVWLARQFVAPWRVFGTFVAIVVVEVVLKRVVERGRLDDDGFHIVAFDQSFPSGHAARTTFLFLLAWRLWPRARPVLAIWLAAILVGITLNAWHVPTDVVGGALLALVAFTAVAPLPLRDARVVPHPAGGGTALA